MTAADAGRGLRFVTLIFHRHTLLPPPLRFTLPMLVLLMRARCFATMSGHAADAATAPLLRYFHACRLLLLRCYIFVMLYVFRYATFRHAIFGYCFTPLRHTPAFTRCHT